MNHGLKCVENGFTCHLYSEGAFIVPLDPVTHRSTRCPRVGRASLSGHVFLVPLLLRIAIRAVFQKWSIVNSEAMIAGARVKPHCWYQLGNVFMG
jgi:hypothetical protein